MSAPFQTTYFFSNNGTTAGYLELAGGNLIINQVAQNNVDCRGIFNANLPINTVISLIGNNNNSIILKSLALPIVGLSEDVDIIVSTIYSNGVFTVNDTCMVNVEYVQEFSELRGVNLIGPASNDILQINGSGEITNVANINVNSLTGVLPVSKGGTGSTALQLLNGTMVCSDSGTLKGLKFTPVGDVVGTSDTQTLTNKNLISLTNTLPGYVTSLGEVYTTTNQNLTLVTQNVWYPFTFAGSVLVSNNAFFATPKFQLNSNKIQYIGAEPCIWNTSLSISLESNNSGNEYEIALSLDGIIPIPSTIYALDIISSNDKLTFSCSKVLTLAQNDTIYVIMRNIDADNRIIATNNLNFVMMSCGSRVKDT